MSDRFRLLAALVLPLALAGSARADGVWRWTDKAGNVHYTDDPGAIPEQSRKAAKKTRGADLGELGSSRSERKAATTSAEPEESVHIELAEETEARDEARWRARFRSIRARIAELEKSREALTRTVKDPAGSGMPVGRDPAGIMRPNPEYDRAKVRLAETEAELVRAREELADLERRAANASVPLEWRR